MCEKIQRTVEKTAADGAADRGCSEHAAIELVHFKLVTRMGSVMLLNGGEIFRTNAAMRYAAKALHLPEFNAFVIANGIFASMASGGKMYSCRICCVPLGSINLCRVEAVNSLSRRIAAGLNDVSVIEKELDRIETLDVERNLTKVFSSGVGSASFCYLFGGSLADSMVAFAAGVALYLYLLYVVPRLALPKIMVNVTTSAIAAIVCCMLYSAGAGDQLGKIITGAVFPMYPGIPLTNAIRNFMENDYLSGIIRLADALLAAGCIATGVGIVMRMWAVELGGLF